MLGTLSPSVAVRFARSLRESGAHCTLVILLPSTATGSGVLRSVASDWQAELVAYDPKTPRLVRSEARDLHSGGEARAAAGRGWRPSLSLGRPKMPRGAGEKLLRYWAALRYLEAARGKHAGRRVLLADCRDVVFQRDPFSIAHEPARPLVVFMEDYLRDFNNSGINLGHVLPCFGRAAVRQVLQTPPRPVSCSGVTLGSAAAVRGYLAAMWHEMSEKRYSSDCLRHDQAFHNWLLWSGALGVGVRACSAELGPVSTIGWPEHLYRDRYGRVLNRAGEVAHVVHQFDRRKQLVDSLGARCTAAPRRAPPRRPPPAAPPPRAPHAACSHHPPSPPHARCRASQVCLARQARASAAHRRPGRHHRGARRRAAGRPRRRCAVRRRRAAHRRGGGAHRTPLQAAVPHTPAGGGAPARPQPPLPGARGGAAGAARPARAVARAGATA